MALLFYWHITLKLLFIVYSNEHLNCWINYSLTFFIVGKIIKNRWIYFENIFFYFDIFFSFHTMNENHSWTTYSFSDFFVVLCEEFALIMSLQNFCLYPYHWLFPLVFSAFFLRHNSYYIRNRIKILIDYCKCEYGSKYRLFISGLTRLV